MKIFGKTKTARRRPGGGALRVERLESRRMLAAELLISEFMASNQTTLDDDDGDAADWIEIFNAGDQPGELAGWHLTDDHADLTKWRFPDVTLDPGELLTVFASDKDRSDPAQPLHTNFKLSAGGEYLALVQPDGTTIATEFLSEYPPQFADVSYGMAMVALVDGTSPGGGTVPVEEGTPILQYGFDFTSGTVAANGNVDDDSGSGNDGLVFFANGGTYSADIPTENVQNATGVGSLDTSTGYLSTNTSGAYSGTGIVDFGDIIAAGGLTLESWFKGGDAAGAFQGLIEAAGAYNLGGAGGEIGYENGFSGTPTVLEFGAPLDTSVWNHAAVVLSNPVANGTTLDVTVTVYHNGTAVAGGSDNISVDLDRAVGVGGHGVFSADQFTGLIYEPRISLGALSAAAFTYAGGPIVVPEPDVILQYGFDFTSGTVDSNVGTVIDDSSAGNDGLPLGGGGGVYTADVPPAEKVQNAFGIGSLDVTGAGLSTAASLGVNSGQGIVSAADVYNAGGLTMEAWIKNGSAASGELGHPGLVLNVAGMYALAATSDGKVGFVRGDYVLDDRWTIAKDTSDWTHLAVVMETTDPTAFTYDAITAYVDGESIFSGSHTFPFFLDRAASVGHHQHNLAWGPYDGLVYEPRITLGAVDPQDFTFTTETVEPETPGAVYVLVPDDDSVDASWTSTAFDDGTWEAAANGIGYETSPGDLDGLIQFPVASGTTTAYVRYPFELETTESLDRLMLRMKYDDGFVAYLNGTKIAESNAPDSPAWDSVAAGDRPDGSATRFETFDVSVFADLLVPGENVLAVHGLNSGVAAEQMLVLADLAAFSTTDYRYLATATPDARNLFDGAQLGPLPADIMHQPATPTDSDEIVVTTRVIEIADPVDTVRLTFRVMYGAETTTAMLDNGVAPDVALGDGIYTGAIPAGIAASGEMVRYFIVATDQSGHESRAPRLPDPSDTDGLPEYFGTVIHDASIATSLPVLQWFVPNPTWHMNSPGNPGGGNNKSWSPASVFFDGEFYDNLKVRVRGTATTVNWTKPKFKFEFNDVHEFRYANDRPRVDEFNLQSYYVEVLAGAGYGPNAYMRENLANRFLQDIGVPASNTLHMHVRQNGAYYSLASFIEQVDKTFLRRHGLDDDGAMYKATPGNSNLAPNPSQSLYRKVTRKDEPWDDFIELTDGLAGLIPGVDRATYLFDNIDLPEVVNVMAGRMVLMDVDRLTKNYYMYRDTEGDGEWSRFPWDTEQTFADPLYSHWESVLYGDSEHTQGSSNQAPYFNYLLDAVLDTPATREMYLRRIRTLMDEYLGDVPGYFEDLVDGYHSLIASDAALDNAKWGAGNIAAGVDGMKANIQTHRERLAADPLVPGSSTGEAVDIRFEYVEFNPASGNQDHEYIELTNHGAAAVDISNWRLDGGVRFTFQPGTVIPANSTMYVSPDLAAFRARPSGPGGGQGLFVQGGYSGHMSNLGETINLVDPDAGQQVVASITLPFVPSPAQRFLRIGEIMYHPADPATTGPESTFADDDDFEFIELVNTSDTETLVLDGVSFTQGIAFDFVDENPAVDETTLAPGDRILVVRNLDAFDARYEIAGMAVAGEYRVPDGTNKLSNGGETLKLEDADNSTIQEFAYDDSVIDGWSAAADGSGRSLEAVSFDDGNGDPAAWNDYGDSAFWHASPQENGSPGASAMAAVIGRHVFYDGSNFDMAIATDKAALLSGETATLGNVTNYSSGINGIIVDLAHAPNTAALDIGNLALTVGNDNNPTTWDAVPGATLDVRLGGGRGGSDRLVITWADNAPKNTWLEVTIPAAGNTGLPTGDVFYFGNAIGETGDDAQLTLVNAADVIAIRDNPRGLSHLATIDNPHDINRDGSVNATDMILARNNATSPLSALRLITPAEPAAPTPAGEGELTATGKLARTGTPSVGSLDDFMATQAYQSATDSLLPTPTLSKLLRRLGGN